MENVITTQSTVPTQENTQKKVVYKLDQIMWFIIGVIDALLVARLLLRVLGANSNNGFTSFIYSLTELFVMPFRGILGNPTYGNNQFEWATLIAIIVIAMIGMGIAYFIRLGNPVSEQQVATADNQ